MKYRHNSVMVVVLVLVMVVVEIATSPMQISMQISHIQSSCARLRMIQKRTLPYQWFDLKDTLAWRELTP